MKKILCFVLSLVMLSCCLISCKPSEDLVYKMDMLRVDVETLQTEADKLGAAGKDFADKVDALHEELEALDNNALSKKLSEYEAKLLELQKELEKLGIGPDECTADGKFSLTAARCVGACGLAPVMMVNEDVYGRITVDDVDNILGKYAE